jgi:hypothetical protein
MVMAPKSLEGVKATPELLSLLADSIAKAANSYAATTAPDGSGSSQNEDVLALALASAVTRAKAPLPMSQAQPLLKSRSNDEVVSMEVIRAMYSVLRSDKQASTKLDGALANTRLVYSSPPPPEKETDEQRRFRRRMDRLRLRAEEARYVRLTKI